MNEVEVEVKLTPRNARGDKYTKHCAALTGRGTPCRAYALRDGEYCLTHSKTAAERKQLSRQMLQSKAEQEQLRELARDAAIEVPDNYLDSLPQSGLSETQDVLLERLRVERQAREDTAIESMIDASDEWVGVVRLAAGGGGVGSLR